jgi:hypothetical protein
MPNVDLQSLVLSSLPSAEDGTFEFKSSTTPQGELKKKINRAASGFANSGGGCFLAGIDDRGNVDGGLATTVGRQSLSDWADQAIQGIEPTIRYQTRLIDDPDGRGTLDSGNVVLAIAFSSSESAPHMANDSRYYIRAGAHTVPASAFIVEALWARRGQKTPMLCYVVRTKPNYADVVQIGVVALNSAPALDVEFNITPLGGLLKDLGKYFPIRLPLVDQNTPFFIDSTLYHRFDEEFDENTKVTLRYRDVAGHEYDYQSQRPLREAINPIRIGTEPADKIVKAIKELAKK